jgi:hypothetical protein
LIPVKFIFFETETFYNMEHIDIIFGDTIPKRAKKRERIKSKKFKQIQAVKSSEDFHKKYTQFRVNNYNQIQK